MWAAEGRRTKRRRRDEGIRAADECRTFTPSSSPSSFIHPLFNQLVSLKSKMSFKRRVLTAKKAWVECGDTELIPSVGPRTHHETFVPPPRVKITLSL